MPFVSAVMAQETPWGDVLAGDAFQSWGVEDGLAERRVFDILVDRQGFVWMATQNGLNRFDGDRFETYQHDPADPTSLADNYLFCLLEDEPGFLWIGTASGIERFDTETGEAVHYLADPDDPGDLLHTNISRLHHRADGGLWIVTEGGVVQFDPDRNQHEPLTLDLGGEEEVAKDVYELADGGRWLALAKSLVRQDATGAVVERHAVESVSSMLLDHSGVLWFASDSGLQRLASGGRPEVFRFDGAPGPSSVHDLVEDGAHRLWVATFTGLVGIDASRETLSRFVHRPGEPGVLRADLVLALTLAPDGALWAATNDGANRIDPARDAFSVYRHQPGREPTLGPGTVLTIAEGSEGALWVGHLGGGLDRLDLARGSVERYRKTDDPASLASDVVWSVLEDWRGDLWVGTEAGLERMGPEGRLLGHDFGVRAEYEDVPRVLTLLEGTDGGVWVGHEGGLARLGEDPGRVAEAVAFAQTPFAVLTLLEETPAVLWIGSDHGGLFRLDRRAGEIRNWRRRAGDPDSLANDVVTGLHHDVEGTLWVATLSGLQRLDGAAMAPEDADFLRIELGESVSVKGLVSFGEDLWLSTHRDLVRYRPSDGRVDRFGVALGLPPGFTTKSFGRGAETLYFGGRHLVAVHPERLRPESEPPGIALTGLWVGGGEVPLRRGRFEGAEIEYQEAVVGHRASSFTVELAPLHYAAPQLNRAAYLLEGFDTDWMEVSIDQRRVRYTNLDPGRYVFKARARNPSGIWSREVAHLAVVVEAPPWKRPWAYALYLAFGIGAIWRVVHVQRRKVAMLRAQVATHLELQRTTRELEKLSAERGELVVELAARRDELTMLQRTLSHDLRNPLTTIANFSGLLRRGVGDDDGEQRQHLGRIDGAVRTLDRLLIGMVDFTHLADPADLDHTVDWVQLFGLAAERVRPALDERQIRLDIAPDLPMGRGDRDRLRIVAQHLLDNAIEFTRPAPWPRIEVRHQDLEDRFRITVADNGPGIASEYHALVFELFEQLDPSSPGSGVGLAMAKRIVEDHGGRIWIEPTLPGEDGCAVTFELPRADDPAA